MDLPIGLINDTSSGKRNSFPFPTSNSLVSVSGLFELAQRPSRDLELPCALLPELQRIKDTIKCAAVDAEVPGDTEKNSCRKP